MLYRYRKIAAVIILCAVAFGLDQILSAYGVDRRPLVEVVGMAMMPVFGASVGRSINSLVSNERDPAVVVPSLSRPVSRFGLFVGFVAEFYAHNKNR